MHCSAKVVLAAAVLALPAAALVAAPGAPVRGADDSGSFLATFDTAADFYGRFDTYTGNYCTNGTNCRPEDISDAIKEFPGSHSMACQAPPSVRTVNINDHDNLFWWCAPGGAPTGHLMSGLNTSGYSLVNFSPKESFTNVRQVCWDMSLADLGGGKWANVVIVPEATYLSHPNTNPRRVEDGEGPYRLDYVTPDFIDPGGPGSFNIQDLGSGAGALVGVKQFRGTTQIYRGSSVLGFDGSVWTAGADESTRFKHCFRDNRNGTLTYTQQRATGLHVVTTSGAFPTGPVRVLFQDDTYDADKHGGTGRYTWHWDNVYVEWGSGPPLGITTPAPSVDYPPSVAGQFDSLSPARLLDTRAANSTIDGLDAGGGPKPAGSVTTLQVAGRGRVPANARAVSLNVTAVGPQSDGFATVFPCGAVPTASNLNYRAGEVVPNAVIADLDANGNVCVYTYAATHLLVDVNGAFPTQSDFEPLRPARLYDSRSANSTVDGAGAGEGVRGAGVVTRVRVAGRGGVPADASAAAFNVTIVDALGDGFATMFPCGQSVPVASNLNYRSGDILANMVVSELGGDDVCVYTDDATHLVVDVAGWFPAANASATPFGGVRPARVLDTRQPNSTVDGLNAGDGAVAPGGIVEVTVAGRGGVPAGAGAVTLNVTVVSPDADGFATVYPCGQPVPVASNLNFRAGDVVPNAVVSRVGSEGGVCIFADARTQLLADVTGWFPG